MNETSASSRLSFLLPNLGWFVSALVIVWFFVWAKPQAYKDGFAQGQIDQTAMDKQAYELATGMSDAPTLGTSINLRVVRVQPGSILADTLVFNQQNPFGKTTEQKTVVYNQQTVVVKRQVISPDEYARRIKAAEQAGNSSLVVPPFDDIPASIEDIQPSDRIEVDVLDGTTLQSPSFLAQTIAIIQPTLIKP